MSPKLESSMPTESNSSIPTDELEHLRVGIKYSRILFLLLLAGDPSKANQEMCLIPEVDGLETLLPCLFLTGHGLRNRRWLLMFGPTSLLPSSSSVCPGCKQSLLFWRQHARAIHSMENYPRHSRPPPGISITNLSLQMKRGTTKVPLVMMHALPPENIGIHHDNLL